MNGVLSDWPLGRALGLLLGGAALTGIAGLAMAEGGEAPLLLWLVPILMFWALAWAAVHRLAAARFTTPRAVALQRLGCAALFGIAFLVLWEAVVTGFQVPPVILPAPSPIGARIASSLPVLGMDVVQTVLRGALTGYVIGCSAAVITALLIDRSPFLQRGLLPLGNLVAALPIVGVAPIMVMWFGSDWQSKATVVVVMVFFPMLVNTVEGLKAADRMQLDLMRTYAANYRTTLWKLRFPMAAPFMFNGLKICSTLALIGAIVAEFFGSPTLGMGFRISTEAGRFNFDMVWAEIAAAAICGSAFYGAVTLIERRATFWHPSQRG